MFGDDKREGDKMNSSHNISFLVLLFTLAVVITTVIIMPAFGNMESKICNIEKVYVESGDSLWKIAKKYGPQDQDIRKTIYEIKKYNNLQDSYIYQGQVLKVPTENN